MTGSADSRLGSIFTAADALRAGISRRNLGGPDYRRLIRGVYIAGASPPSLAEQVRYLLSLLPHARFASHHTAAALWGAVTPQASDIHLGTPKRRHLTHRGVRLHFYTHRPELVQHCGVWVTSPAQTFLDLAAVLEFTDLLVLGDSLVRHTALTPAQLRAFVADRHCNGARRAREVAAHVRSKVDSPNESKLRLLITSAGLVEPTTGHVVSLGLRYRQLDLAYDELKLAIEFDGRYHMEREAQWDSDILRREEVEALGWRFVIITSTAMFREPLQVLTRIGDATQLRTGQPVVIHDGWRRHFG